VQPPAQTYLSGMRLCGPSFPPVVRPRRPPSLLPPSRRGERRPGLWSGQGAALSPPASTDVGHAPVERYGARAASTSPSTSRER
jgi:hypothetical protein